MNRFIYLLLSISLAIIFFTPIAFAGQRSAATCTAGSAAGYACNGIHLMAFVPLSELGGSAVNDIWAWEDPLTGKEYALVGRDNGTSFIDISIPTAPVVVGNLPTQSGNRIQRDVKTLGNYALIVSESSGHGLQIFDLTTLRGLTETTMLVPTAVYTGFGRAHNVVINPSDSSVAYIVGTVSDAFDNCSGGLHILDMTEPLTPTFASCFADDGYTHDAQCITYDGPDTAFIGRDICFNFNTDTVTIVDVTNPLSPTQISRTPYTGSRYTHQGWLTEDRKHLLVGDELDELSAGINARTYIWDVTSLVSPTVDFTWTSSEPSIDHNLYIEGNYAYLANYTAGLRVLDLTNIDSDIVSEIAYFDVYTPTNNPAWDGAWSSYPWLSNNLVIVNSIDEGTFILQMPTIPTAVGLMGQSADAATVTIPIAAALLVLFTLLIWRFAHTHNKGV